MQLTFDGMLLGSREGVTKTGKSWKLYTFFDFGSSQQFSLFALPSCPHDDSSVGQRLQWTLEVQPYGRSFSIANLTAERPGR